MADNTKIEWVDRTWSPWIGCQKVGPGCDHCYAEALNKRTGGSNWGPDAPRRRTSEAYWKKPLRWNGQGRSTVFPSMCDPFDNAVDPIWRRDFAATITVTPNLTWLLLTKRIGNAAAMLADMFPFGLPANVWVGATIVNRDELLRDGPKLRMVPARIRFWSVEPMLGDLGDIPGWLLPEWVIAGGESGALARPMNPDWVRSLRDQSAAAGVPFMLKQWGEWLPAGQRVANMTYFHDDDDRQVDLALMSERRREAALDGVISYKVGKKRAGRLLDGVLHDGFPEVS